MRGLGMRAMIAGAAMLGMTVPFAHIGASREGRVATLPSAPREQRKKEEAKRRRRPNAPGTRGPLRRHPKALRFVGWPGRGSRGGTA